MKIVVFGSSGQLGKSLIKILKNYDWEILEATRANQDVTNHKKIENFLSDVKPDIVVNASAYTAVDMAESEPNRAHEINEIAVKNLARLAKLNNATLIHFSTDYVFDGTSLEPYTELDKTNPTSVYGKSKLYGENEIRSSECNHIILRTSWVYGEYGNNFIKTMLNLSKIKRKISIVSDQYGCPTYSLDLAKAVVAIIKKIEANQCKWGTYNYCGDKPLSWYEFAKLIFKKAHELGARKNILLKPILTLDYPTPATRPLYSVLCMKKFINEFGHDPSKVVGGIDSSFKHLIEKGLVE